MRMMERNLLAGCAEWGGGEVKGAVLPKGEIQAFALHNTWAYSVATIVPHGGYIDWFQPIL